MFGKYLCKHKSLDSRGENVMKRNFTIDVSNNVINTYSLYLLNIHIHKGHVEKTSWQILSVSYALRNEDKKAREGTIKH